MLRIEVRLLLLLFACMMLSILLSIFAGKTRNSPILSFISNGHGNRDIFFFDVQTRQLHNYTLSPHVDEWSYVWSRDGSRIAYSVPTGSSDDLFVMDADGRNRQQVNSLTTLQAFNLTWSPDNAALAYFSSYQNSSELYLISLAENSVTNLSNTPDISESFPEWSPNGENLLFAMRNDLYLRNMETGAITQITDTPNSEEYPVWSPDGSRIAFQRPREFSGEPQLFMLTLGAGKADLLDTVILPRSQPVSWSPHSTAFVIALDSQQIVIFDVEGDTIEAITDGTQRTSGAIWSPDGRYIAYIENRQIQVYDLHTGHTIPLGLTIGSLQPPLIWQP